MGFDQNPLSHASSLGRDDIWAYLGLLGLTRNRRLKERGLRDKRLKVMSQDLDARLGLCLALMKSTKARSLGKTWGWRG